MRWVVLLGGVCVAVGVAAGVSPKPAHRQAARAASDHS